VSKKNQIKTENLSRLMVYILGYKPYEFGLIPDNDGFFFYKELLKAIHEEPGWGHVRQGHINEVLLGKDRDLFKTEEKRIRAIDKHWNLDLEQPSQSLPKILFIGIRRRAHPVAMKKGLRRIDGAYYVLSPLSEVAERIGKRRDQRPVLLEIMAGVAQAEGYIFYPFGNLFLAPEISFRHISGPPIPKDIIKAREEKSSKTQKLQPDFQAGTFVLDLNRDMDQSHKPAGRKKKGWKEEARKHRRRGMKKPFKILK